MGVGRGGHERELWPPWIFIHLGSYASTWIKVDPGSTSFGSSKILIESV